MLDIHFVREHPDIVKRSEQRRGKDPSAVDEVLRYDKLWKETLEEASNLRAEMNRKKRKVAELKKSGNNDEANALIKELKGVSDKIAELEKKEKDYLARRNAILYTIGNILHDSVPDGKDEEDNAFVRFWGKAKVYVEDLDNFLRLTEKKGEYVEINWKPKSHADIIGEYNIADTKKAGEVAGARFYYLKRDLVFLNLALIHFALEELSGKGFVPMWTPYMLKRETMAAAAELADFEETLYHIKDEDMFMIATAEQPLAAYHMNEVIEEIKLPLRYVGFSTNFRREAGAHGKDTKGIFRVHQFDKIEQYVYSKPEESWDIHEEITHNTEGLFQKLELPYRVINICAGDMNDTAAKKYDIEVWMPAQGTFRELASCSNTTTYQSRKMNVKVIRRNREREVLHTLNCTGLATERTMVAIIENFQDEDGVIHIPKALHKYLPFKEIMPPSEV